MECSSKSEATCELEEDISSEDGDDDDNDASVSNTNCVYMDLNDMGEACYDSYYADYADPVCSDFNDVDGAPVSQEECEGATSPSGASCVFASVDGYFVDACFSAAQLENFECQLIGADEEACENAGCAYWEGDDVNEARCMAQGLYDASFGGGAMECNS